MKKHNMTIMDVYHNCYSLSPDIRVDVYREAIVDHMFIFADGSKINKLVFALKDQSLDYGKE